MVINTPYPQPLSPANLTRLLVIAVVVLAIMAGYYHNAFLVQQKKYAILQKKYQALQEN